MPLDSLFFGTGDRGLEFQQNLAKRKIGVIVLRAPSNAIEDLIPLIPAAIKAIEEIQSGEVIRIEA